MSYRGSLFASHFTLCIYLELESGHPDHHGVPCDAEHDGQRVEDDGHVVHDGVNVYSCPLVILRRFRDEKRLRGVGKHLVTVKHRIKENQNITCLRSEWIS